MPPPDLMVVAIRDISELVDRLHKLGCQVSGKLDVVRGIEEHHVQWLFPAPGQEQA